MESKSQSLLFTRVHVGTTHPGPTRTRVSDAGFDLYANIPDIECMKLQKNSRLHFMKEGLSIYPGSRAIIPTGVAVSCPSNVVLQIWPRSGLALNHGVDVLAGVIDSGYRGEICCILINHGSDCFVVKHGSKIAQLLPVRLHDSTQLTFTEVSELPPADRDQNGFGSSGM